MFQATRNGFQNLFLIVISCCCMPTSFISVLCDPQGNAALPKGNLEKHYDEGVLFVTYSLLVSNTKQMAEPKLAGANGAEGQDAEEEQIYHIPKGSRLQQIVDWLNGGEGDPLIVSPHFI